MLNNDLFQKVTKNENGKRSGLKHTEYPAYIDDMKASVREFNLFVSKTIERFNHSNEIYKLKTKGVNNNWQNSGYYNPYFWNKILLYDNDYDGVIIWFLFNIEGLRITIGTTSTLESVNSDLARRINSDFKDIYTEGIDGFETTMDNKYISYLYTRNEINEDVFVAALNKVVPKYKNIFIKYQDEIFNTGNIQDTTIADFVEKEVIIKIQNIILYGSPGVGKTHNTNKLISLIESGVSEKEIFETIKNNEENNGVDANRIVRNISSRVKFITFHQSFGYEDFIEGFRPNENGDIKLQDGIFKSICDDADNDRNNNYYLVIDEINRGNISKIFGELITLIEEDKRDTLEVTLPYSKKPFKIPSNLYIIGTMNSTDKSIALIDIALRRRFTFLKMEPNLELVDNEKAKNIMEQLNKKITDTLGADYVLGHSYFMKIENDDDLEFVFEYKIKPLLEEYFYGDEVGLKNILEIMNV